MISCIYLCVWIKSWGPVSRTFWKFWIQSVVMVEAGQHRVRPGLQLGRGPGDWGDMQRNIAWHSIWKWSKRSAAMTIATNSPYFMSHHVALKEGDESGTFTGGSCIQMDGPDRTEIKPVGLNMFVDICRIAVANCQRLHYTTVCSSIWCFYVRLNTPLHRWILYRRSRGWQVPEGGAWCVVETHFFHFFQHLPASHNHHES